MCKFLCSDSLNIFNSENELHPKKLPMKNVTPESPDNSTYIVYQYYMCISYSYIKNAHY